MKKLLILPLLLAFQLVSAQWNTIGWNPYLIRDTSGDSTFVLSAPSRQSIKEGVASWTPSTSGGASYLVYTALLTQTETSAPVATVLENTLGGTVVWTYFDVGLYIGTLSGAFTDPYKVYGCSGFVSIPDLWSYSCNRSTANTISLQVTGDNQLSLTPIEIRVYNP